MGKREKLLLVLTIGLAGLDGVMAYRTWVKKKGIVLRDMILTSLDGRIHGNQNPGDDDAETHTIPIE